MSDEYRSPWDVLELAYEASEKEVRRAYAVRLKQIDPSVDTKAFELLRWAYEIALRTARQHGQVAPEAEVNEPVVDQPSAAVEMAEADMPVPAPSQPDPTATFQAMIDLAHARDYDVERWLPILNDPVLDDPWVSSRFEYALVQELSENELKTEYMLSAGAEWRALIESRYAWVADGLRYARMFPNNPDLRAALVEEDRSRPARYVPSFSQQAKEMSPWWIAFIVMLVAKACFEMWSRSKR